MSKSIKEKIHKLVGEIDDEASLHQLMEEAAFYTSNYTSKKNVVDDLTAAQLAELDAAVAEADKGETIEWDDFKKEMNEWRKK